MIEMKRSQQGWFSSLGISVLLMLMLSTPARAIVINDTAGAAQAISLGVAHTAVVELFAPAGFCTGALIDNTHIITAQHCTFGADPGQLTVRFHHQDGNSNDIVTSYGVSAKAEPDNDNNYYDGSDVAILTLDSPAPIGIDPLPLSLGNPTGLVAESVGFGYAGIGSWGAAGGNGTRRAVENVIDYYGEVQWPPGTPSEGGNFFNTDFDDGSAAKNTLSGLGSSPTMLPNEGTTAGGDSGGPLLVNGQIVGVLTGGSTGNSPFGDISWWTGTHVFESFIQANAPNAVFGLAGPADTPSNASFSNSVDQDVLNIDFGVVAYQGTVDPIEYAITNLPIGVSVAELELQSIIGTGNASRLTTNATTFDALSSGYTNSYEAFFDTTVVGDFAAAWDFNFTDEMGTNQTITLNLTGEISNDDPNLSDLVYDAETGNLYIDPRDAGGIDSYQLQSAGQFLSAGFTPVLGGSSTATASELSEIGAGLTSPAGIGVVLPAGLELGEVWDLLTLREATTDGGVSTVEFDVVVACILGDADCDGDVDVGGDIFPAFSNFTGPGSFGMTRESGDIQVHPFGDGDVDVSDLITMFAQFTGPSGPADSSEAAGFSGLVAAEAGDWGVPDLIYDPLTGEVVLDAGGSAIYGYVLMNGDNSFSVDGYTSFLSGVTTARSGELSAAAMSSPSGSNSLGMIFPVGMSYAELSEFLTTNQVSRGLGAPLVGFDLVVVGSAVPEPSTWLLAGMGLLGVVLLGRRRQRV